MLRLLLTLAFTLLPFSTFAAIECPAPPQQLGHDVVTTTTGKLQTLGRLAGGELSNETQVLAKDLFHDYKDADKVVIANMMISIFCQQLRDSTTLSDNEKLDRLSIFSGQVFAATIDKRSDIDIRRNNDFNHISELFEIPVTHETKTSVRWGDPLDKESSQVTLVGKANQAGNPCRLHLAIARSEVTPYDVPHKLQFGGREFANSETENKIKEAHTTHWRNEYTFSLEDVDIIEVSDDTTDTQYFQMSLAAIPSVPFINSKHLFTIAIGMATKQIIVLEGPSTTGRLPRDDEISQSAEQVLIFEASDEGATKSLAEAFRTLANDCGAHIAAVTEEQPGPPPKVGVAFGALISGMFPGAKIKEGDGASPPSADVGIKSDPPQKGGAKQQKGKVRHQPVNP